jgi:hypothetical protein
MVLKCPQLPTGSEILLVMIKDNGGGDEKWELE